MQGPVILDDLVSLRPPPANFAQLLCRWYADPAVTRYLNLRFPPTLESMEGWQQQLAASSSDVVWSIVRGDAPIGIVLLKDIDWRRRGGHVGVGVAGVLHVDRGRCQRAASPAVGTANRARAEGAHEVGADFPATPPMTSLLHHAPLSISGRESRTVILISVAITISCWRGPVMSVSSRSVGADPSIAR
jgi:hypothetical protein